MQTVPAGISRPDHSRPPVPDPQPIRTTAPKFKVLTTERLPDLFKGAECGPPDKHTGMATCTLPTDWVVYGLDPKQYEILAKDMADILRWVKEAKWRLRYYRGVGGLDGKPQGKN